VCAFYRKDSEFVRLGEISKAMDKGKGKKKQKK